ncbi:MAG: hypothetical protein WEC75_11475 [Dehalococcoidia bacterium]
MAGEIPSGRDVPPPCRWRTSAETLDLIEALERIEALLIRLDERLRPAAPRGGRMADDGTGATN